MATPFCENYMTVIALLLHAVGGNTFDIFMNLADHGTTFNHDKAAITNNFKPTVNKEYERAVFRRLRQETGESIDVYAYVKWLLVAISRM